MRKRRTTRIPDRTPDEQAAYDARTRLVEERIAYHTKMSELLGEREREAERIAELELRRKAS